MRNARRFVADLISRRRPRSFDAGPEDAAEIRAAIMLRAGAPGGGEPSEEFVDQLRARLGAALSTPDGSVPPPASRRRLIVRTATLATGSAAAGMAVGFVLGGSDDPTDAPDAGSPVLDPASGVWRAVAASDDLPEGAIQPFDLGTVSGFVQRTNGGLSAVSGVCTHLGCRLGLDAPNRRLNCPCHRTSFSTDGAVIFHQLPSSPPPLPHLMVREANGIVEILAPPGA